MKKIVLAITAVAALATVACNKAEVVEQSPANAIAFDNVFVDNAVKSVVDPSYSAAKLFNDFAVFGFVEGASLFDGVKVSGFTLDGEWTYEGTQYWIAGAKYNFSAVAPFTGNWSKTTATKDGVSLSFTNTGSQDVLYAQSAEIEGQASNNSKVAFTFRHILSKVKFSFENGYNASAATIKVYDIKITNAYKTGNVALTSTGTTWSDQAGADDFVLDFGAAVNDNDNTADAYAYNTTLESYNELLLIPGEITDGYNVTFKVDLLVSGQLIKTYEHTATVKFSPEPGACYDIKAVVNAENIDPNQEQEPIEFTVTKITDWTGPKDETATIN